MIHDQENNSGISRSIRSVGISVGQQSLQGIEGTRIEVSDEQMVVVVGWKLRL
jgi:hypothetical protein